MKVSPIFLKTFGILITILTPFVIILTMVRLMLTPILLEVEYRMPAFPADPYGFTQKDRLKWSHVSINYLLNNENRSYFDTYLLEDGSPLYNDRELSHMDDVKLLVAKGRVIWLGLLVAFTFITLFFYISRKMPEWKIAASWGGWLTVCLIGFILASVMINFDWFFNEFHKIFFTSDSWLFYYSDTFIRLFPLRFWSDIFIYVGVLSVGVSYLLIKLGKSR